MFDDTRQVFLDKLRGDDDFFALAFRCGEGHIFQQVFHDGMEAPCADIFGFGVYAFADFAILDGTVSIQGHTFISIIWYCRTSEHSISVSVRTNHPCAGCQFHADGKASRFRDEVGYLAL